MDRRVEHIANMTPEQERQFWEQFERDVDSDTGEAAKAHLAAGRPIWHAPIATAALQNLVDTAEREVAGRPAQR